MEKEIEALKRKIEELEIMEKLNKPISSAYRDYLRNRIIINNKKLGELKCQASKT